MRRKLTEIMAYLLLSIPWLYLVMLSTYAFIYYRAYYDNSLWQIPFDFSSLLLGTVLSFGSLLSIHLIALQQRQALQTQVEQLAERRQVLQSRLTEFESQLAAFQNQLTRANQDNQRLQESMEAYEQEKQEFQQDLNQCQAQLNEAQQKFHAELAEIVQEKQTVVQNHKNLLAEFLVTQKFEAVFNSDLFKDLQRGEEISQVKKLTGGYSGAQVYSFCRGNRPIPTILKIADKREIENEAQKFNSHVSNQLLIGPKLCHEYPWGSYAGLEYNLNWNQLGSDHLTFSELYKECLYRNRQPPVEIKTVVRVVKRLFLEELRGAWNWGDFDLKRVNIYTEHFPFTRKFAQIYPPLESYFNWGQANLGLTIPWTDYWQALDKLLRLKEWNRRQQGKYHFHIAKAIIHGDLNSRNILLETNNQNHNDIHTIGLVDFSHTGNGLTMVRTDEFINQGLQLAKDKTNLASDFCRLEADIKFCLTDLDDEQDLRQILVLECLLLHYGLDIPDVEEPPLDGIKDTLTKYGWSNEPKLVGLTDQNCWRNDKGRKFLLVWQSVKAIRDSLKEILPALALTREPFYLALLQASLTMIYYQDDRFHNADLQKLYLALASALLCTKLV